MFLSMIVAATTFALVQHRKNKNDVEGAAESTASNELLNNPEIDGEEKSKNSNRLVHAVNDLGDETEMSDTAQSQHHLPKADENPDSMNDIEVVAKIFPSEIEKIINSAYSMEDLGISLTKKGIKAKKDRAGSQWTGYRQVITIDPPQSNDLIQYLHIAYQESGDKLTYDKFYFGIAPSATNYRRMLEELDSTLKDLAVERNAKEDFIEWVLPGNRHVFIDPHHIRGDKEMILVGHEMEIH